MAADLRPYPEVLTERTPPPPVPASPQQRRATLEEADHDLLATCGIDDLPALAARCVAARTALGRTTARWSPKCLAMVIKLAVVVRGWPAANVVSALLAIAADPDTRSPARLAEAGPWWDRALATDPGDRPDGDLADLERRLDDIGGRRPAVQAQARHELEREGQPVTRTTVTRRASDILDRVQVPA